MRIRVKIRLSGSRHSVNVESSEDGAEPTVERIKNAIFHQIPSLPDEVENAEAIVLSLNGSSPLENADDELASEAGIVSGDLVHLLNGGTNGVGSGAQGVGSGAQVVGVASAHLTAASPSSSPHDRVNLGDAGSSSNTSNRDMLSGSGTSVLTSVHSSKSQSKSKETLILVDMDAESTSNDSSCRRINPQSTKTVTVSCADYKDGDPLPWLLRQLIDSELPSTKVELVFILIHVLFLEKNFRLVNDKEVDNKTDDSLKNPNSRCGEEEKELNTTAETSNASRPNQRLNLPSEWKRKIKNKLEVVYRHPRSDEVDFVVTVVNMFGTVVVVQARATVRSGERKLANVDSDSSTDPIVASSSSSDSLPSTESFKMQIKPDDYLTPDCLSSSSTSSSSSSSSIFRNLRGFSVSLLDSVVNNVLNEGLALIGCDDDEVSIFSMPFEVTVKILSFLDFRSLARMSIANKFYRDFCSNSQFLWKNLLIRDFPSNDFSADIDDWKSAYKTAFVQRQGFGGGRGRGGRGGAFPNPIFPPIPSPLNPFHDDNPFAPPPLAPPGFLGGDRDLLPGGLPTGFPGGGLPGNFPGGALPFANDLFRPVGPRGLRPPGLGGPSNPGLGGPSYPGLNPLRPRWQGPGGGRYFF